MNRRILGCNIDFRAYDSVTDAIKKELGEEMLLSAVALKTGVEPSAIQNWVKRGFVSNAKGKKYNGEQAAQIILLNNLKAAVQLDEAAGLLEKTKKKSGVSDTDLLDFLASVIIRATRFNSTDRESLKSVVNTVLRESSINSSDVAGLLLTAALSSLCAEYRRLALTEAKAI